MNDFISAKYTGAPWRSRFLRAPKVVFNLATRPEFVRVERLARIRLGAKTGCDKFFFVEHLDSAGPLDVSLLAPKRGSIRIRGMDGWVGIVSLQDLRPAALNPHKLLTPDGRAFSIRRGGDYYLYPREIALRGDLRDYIAYAEIHGIHQRPLVQGNSTGTRWYLQSRGLVTAPWALPYNSAYEYGAWDNSIGAVLNGRFVGVEPVAGVDSDLLGAALNTTMVMAARLLEGKATGVEGAFDVGPPAVRRMLIPDVRRIEGPRADAVREILEECRIQNLMPPAPDRSARVHPLRHRLDLAVLEGLGYSRGEASAIAGRVYESYARWREAVEGVELMMRQNRKAMNAAGQNRTTRPTDLAARRVWEEIEHNYRLFPVDLLTPLDPLRPYNVPRNIEMPAQESLFEAGVVHLPNGKTLNLGSYERVRYAAMLSQIGFEPPYWIPVNTVKAGAIVDAFIAQQASLQVEANRKARSHVAEASALEIVVGAVERAWFRKMRAMGMRPANAEQAENSTAN